MDIAPMEKWSCYLPDVGFFMPPYKISARTAKSIPPMNRIAMPRTRPPPVDATGTATCVIWLWVWLLSAERVFPIVSTGGAWLELAMAMTPIDAAATRTRPMRITPTFMGISS